MSCPKERPTYFLSAQYKSHEWQQANCAAMLIRMYDGLQEMSISGGSFILSKIPLCKLKMELMDDSDEVGTWFFDKCEKGPDADVLIIKDLHVASQRGWQSI